MIVEEKRLARMKEVLSKRQRDLRLFLDRIKNYHNASAIVRTAEAVGVVYIYYYLDKFLPVNDGISLGAEKWVELVKVDHWKGVFQELKDQGFNIYITYLGPGTVDYRDVDYTGKTLIVLGNEKEGVSEEMISYATRLIKIPMYGMVRSLNVSVSAGIILYEALRQREEKGLYSSPSLTEEEMEHFLNLWIYGKFAKKLGKRVEEVKERFREVDL